MPPSIQGMPPCIQGWDSDQRLRLAFERNLVSAKMPQFSFKNLSQDTYITGWARTNSRKYYGIEVQIPPDFPHGEPKLFITSPNPLYKRCGRCTIHSAGLSHEFHTIQNDFGLVQVCFIHDWDPSKTCLLVLLKAHLWLEAYEAYMKTGRSLCDFLK